MLNLILSMKKIRLKVLKKLYLTKLEKKSIVWENLGDSYHSGLNRITYEEVIDDTRPIQTKKVLGVEVATGASG
jgi:hypothetical protein